MCSCLKVITMHLLDTGRVGEIENSHTMMLVFGIVSIGKHGTLSTVKYLYLVYRHLVVFQVI